MSGEICSLEKCDLLILSSFPISKHCTQHDLPAWADEAGEFCVPPSTGHKPLNLSWHRSQRSGTVLSSIEIPLNHWCNGDLCSCTG